MCAAGVAPALGLGSGACRDHGADRTSASTSASPTFLDNDPICEVIPTRLLNEEPGFRPTKYTYWHSPSVGDSNVTFDCQLNGYQTPPGLSAIVILSYFPHGGISTDLSSGGLVTDLDADGLPQVTFDGIEGRGYALTDEDRKEFVEETWLYPDEQTLTLVQHLSNGTGKTQTTGPTYDQGHPDGMRALIQALAPLVPPAAGPRTGAVTSEKTEHMSSIRAESSTTRTDRTNRTRTPAPEEATLDHTQASAAAWKRAS